jgi:hypothetical protein
MSEEQMRNGVKDCVVETLQSGYPPVFEGDPTNRYAVLIESAVAAERERLAVLARDALKWMENAWRILEAEFGPNEKR